MTEKKISFQYLYNRYYKDSVLLKRFARIFSLDILVRGSSFILLPIYLKLMSQDEFGLYGYLFSIISIFSLVLNFGLYLSQAKLYHDYKGEERKSLLFSVNVLLICFLFMIIVPIYTFHLDKYIIAFLFSHPINYEGYRPLLFLAIFVSVYVFMVQNFFMTSESIKKYQLYNLARLVIVNAIVIFALTAKNNDSVMIRLKFGYFTEFVVLLVFSWFYFRQMNTRFEMKYAKKALKIGFPAMLTSLLGMIYSFSDRFILEKYGSFADLALYNLGVTVAGIIMMIFSSFQTVYLPIFFKEKDIEKSLTKTKNIAIRMAAIFIIIGIGIMLAFKGALAFNIIQQKYAVVIFILPILILTQTFQAITHLFNNYITYFEIVYIGTIVVFFLSILNVSLNLIFIPRFNIYGASFSAFIINVCSAVFYYYFIKRKCAAVLAAQKNA